MALVLFQLGFKPLKQREGVRRRTGKTRQHLAMVELADLARRPFDNDVAKSDLNRHHRWLRNSHQLSCGAR